jgi:hypothetical protein
MTKISRYSDACCRQLYWEEAGLPVQLSGEPIATFKSNGICMSCGTDSSLSLIVLIFPTHDGFHWYLHVQDWV